MIEAVVSTHKQALPEHGNSRITEGKAILLFADGTGNAFTKQESNVWRIYRGLDLRSPSQIAHYIPGVGTSGFRPWALVDGATGLGVPSNVRRLFEFLCWNYVEGDRIYLFGFSRGAFTIRTLIGMIDSEGLLSTTGVNGIASRPEMRRNVMSSWRAYRSRAKRTYREEAPTIKVTRWLRNMVLAVRDFACRYESYAGVERRSDRRVQIEFAGLFDTVEAYGVPLEEMRDAINWAVWPIKFRNRVMSDKVKRARHALSLDDERQTFHPVRIDLSGCADFERARIQEVWFAGVHSDVGGGYADDAAALVPLSWMLGQISGEIAFLKDAVAPLNDTASSLAAVHDSRSGLSVFYRYSPRIIGESPTEGGPPTVHHSVIEKMVFGSERYAPHGLPSNVAVLLPNGQRCTIQGFQDEAEASHMRSIERIRGMPTADEIAQQAVEALEPPRPDFVEAVRDGVWLRRKAYFLLLFSLLLTASLPWTNSILGVKPHETNGERLTNAGTLDYSNGVLTAFVQDIASSLGPVIPSYVQPWVKAVVAQPLLSLFLLFFTLLMYWVNGVLKDQIADNARCAWFGFGTGRQTMRRGFLLSCVAALRRHSRGPGKRPILYPIWFVLTLAALAISGFLYFDRVWLSFRIGSGGVCTVDRGQRPRRVNPGVPERAEGFATSNPCWDTGLVLDKGRTYSVVLEMTKPFLDGSLVVDVIGYEDSSWLHWLAAPLKRWPSAAYFQPVARIGSTGMEEWPLRPISGEEPRHLDAMGKVNDGKSDSRCDAIEAPPADVEAVQKQLNLQTIQKSRFVAPASGELYLYVNDAIFGSDLFAWLTLTPDKNCFYKNNSGEAKITVEVIDAGRE